MAYLFERGVPEPLAGLSDGSCAALSNDDQITVYDSQVSPEWTLVARAHWPASIILDSHPWAALAPHNHGILLLNMTACDVSSLPEPVRMSLDIQHQRYASHSPSPVLGPQFRITVGAQQLRITASSGSTRALPIGAPFTVTEQAYRLHQQKTFAFLTPTLRKVARAIADYGPLSTHELLSRVYPGAGRKDLNNLHVQISRLRADDRITVTRLDDGRLTIALATTAEASA